MARRWCRRRRRRGGGGPASVGRCTTGRHGEAAPGPDRRLGPHSKAAANARPADRALAPPSYRSRGRMVMGPAADLGSPATARPGPCEAGRKLEDDDDAGDRTVVVQSCAWHLLARSPPITPMSRLLKIQDIDQFHEIVHVPEGVITPDVLASVRQLDERCELEPMLRDVLWDPTSTPHGPTEIADIISTKVRVRGKSSLAAFVVKGKSFARVRSQQIVHQVVRLRQLPDLALIVLVAVGHIQDDAQRDFIQMARDADCDYLIVDAVDCARILVAYEKICPVDGTPYGSEGICGRGHKQDEGVKLTLRVRAGVQYEIPELQDVSHGGAKRLSAKVLVDSHYGREVLREIIRDVTCQVRQSSYCREELVRKRWGDSRAHVVWLFLGADLRDLSSANWLARTQWVDPDLDQKMRPMELSDPEFIGSIAIAWSDSHEAMRQFYGEHSVDKGRALAQLEPLVERARAVGMRIADLFDKRVGSDDLEENALIGRIRAVSSEINVISDAASNLSLPPQDVKDYDRRAQSLFAHLGNMALYYSEQGVATWPMKDRTFLMRHTVNDFRADLQRLEFEKEKLH